MRDAQRESLPAAPPSSRERLCTATFRLMLAAAAGYLLLYLVLALLRVPYKYELEWMEGGMVDHIARILAGKQLYVAPTMDFVPFIYAPLYFYLAAGLAKLIGLGLLPLRLVSFAASLGCFAMLYLLVRRETGQAWAGLLAAGLFAATYRLSGAWFDVARVDTLALFLLLLTLYLLRQGSTRALILGGVTVALAVFAKQSMLAIVVPLALSALYCYRWRGLVFLATAGLLIAGGDLVLNALHGGWFNYYLWILPRQHKPELYQMSAFWIDDLIMPLPFALALAAAYLGYFGWRRPERPALACFLPMTAGVLAMTWISRIHSGGWDNVVMPAHAMVALLAALGAARMLPELDSLPAQRRALLTTGLFAVCVVQFGMLYYNPIAQVPTAAHAQANRNFLRLLQSLPGENVYVPYTGYLPTLAGKRTCAHAAAYLDILRGADGPIKETFKADVERALREHRFAAIIYSDDTNPDQDWLHTTIDRYYTRQAEIPTAQVAQWCVTGIYFRPRWIFVPR